MKYRAHFFPYLSIQKGVFLLVCILFPFFSEAQRTITGRVTDATDGDPIPKTLITLKGSNESIATDFDGYYRLVINSKGDSIEARSVGYIIKTKFVGTASEQVIDFQLDPEVIRSSYTVRPKENPAWRIMRNVVINKPNNDKSKLSAYQYESYVRTEMSLDHISDKFREKKVIQQISAVVDSMEQLAGEDGELIIPFFISESLSDYYYKRSPSVSREEIKAVKIEGVGVEDGNIVSQLLGSTYQEYNFYDNWLKLVNKDFISPISDSWQTYYRYYLIDSGYVDGDWCYKLEFKPKHPQDLAFKGIMWITDTTFALKQIEASIGKEANINYLEKVTIRQELQETEAGPWIPVKVRIVVDISDISDKIPGVLAKFYTSNKNIVVNQPKQEAFYVEKVAVADDANDKDDAYWRMVRHDSMPSSQSNVYSMIDSIKNVPIVKTYSNILTLVITGYQEIGKFDIGPWAYAYAWNEVEGHRIRMGGRTNEHFSKKLQIHGYVAYGTNDGIIKYGVGGHYVFSKKRWTEMGVERKYDIDQVAVGSEFLTSNLIFMAWTRWFNLRGPYYNLQNKVWFQRELFRDFNQKIMFRTWGFDPAFPFAYYENPVDGNMNLQSQIQTSELIFETRFTRDERWVYTDNSRASLGTKRWPVFTVNYTRGLKNILGGDFGYDKLWMMIHHNFRLGGLGRSFYDLKIGKTFGMVPYPLLEVHIGNETYFYTTAAFNLMKYYEFISDEYVALRYRHYFEGFFFNRIPAIKKLKWRFLFTSNLIYGNLTDKNSSLVSPVDANGDATPQFYTLRTKPYVEVGYGIENIFKVLRVDFVHRLSYLDHPDIRRFGVKLSMQITL